MPRWALITGVTPGGLGEAEAAAFLQKGINVVITSHEKVDLQVFRPKSGSTHGFLLRIQLDVTSSRSISEALKHVTDVTEGRLDFLISKWNNAGYGHFMPLMETNLKEARRQYEVNVWGTLAVIQAFLPILKASKGTIVNQSSITGTEGYNEPFKGIYSSSNAALISLSHTLRTELACFDVKVVILVTSDVKTDFLNNTTGFLKAGLSATSAYFPIRLVADKAIRRHVGLDRHLVAERTIDELLKPEKPTVIRQGYRVAVSWLMFRMLPQWILDAAAMSTFGMYSLRQPDAEE